MSLPMSARAYATEIMETLRRAGITVPLHTSTNHTVQDILTEIVERAMQQVHDHERVPRVSSQGGRNE